MYAHKQQQKRMAAEHTVHSNTALGTKLASGSSAHCKSCSTKLFTSTALHCAVAVTGAPTSGSLNSAIYHWNALRAKPGYRLAEKTADRTSQV